MSTSIRLFSLLGALALSLGSAGGNQQNQSRPAPAVGGGYADSPQAMDESKALGLWKSSFGAVKIERDPKQPGTVRGIWLYERGGQEVIGYFAGSFSGNVMSFSWEEPTSAGPPLVGGGTLTFDPTGESFEGNWWTTTRDRGGAWNGWRGESGAGQGPAEPVPEGFGNDEPLDEVPEPAEPAESDDGFI